jgi:hypothetical protein
MKSIFEMCHANIDMNRLTSMETVLNNKQLLSSFKKIFGDEIKATLEYLEVSPKDVYFDHQNIVYPISYIKGAVIVDIPKLEVEVCKMFKIKERINAMTKKAKRLLNEKDFSSLFSFMDKRLLINQYLELFEQIPNDQKVDIFAHVYTRSEYGFDKFDNEFIEKVFQYRSESEGHKKRMHKLKNVADIDENGYIRVYRGTKSNEIDDNQYSWTLSHTVAIFFANRFEDGGNIFSGLVKLENVLDYYDIRNEREVLILPKNIENIEKVNAGK